MLMFLLIKQFVLLSFLLLLRSDCFSLTVKFEKVSYRVYSIPYLEAIVAHRRVSCYPVSTLFYTPFLFLHFQKKHQERNTFGFAVDTYEYWKYNHKLITLKLHITWSFSFFSQGFDYFGFSVFNFILPNDVSCK